MKIEQTRILMHLALWLPLAFSTPLLVATSNPADIAIATPTLALALSTLTGILTAASYFLSKNTGPLCHEAVSRILLALGLVAVYQGNFVHDLFYYGQFNGETVNWRSYGWRFWLEMVAFCLAIPLTVGVLLSIKKVPSVLTFLPVLSCGLVLIPGLIKSIDGPDLRGDPSFDDSVFEFSDELNLIHLLPDGLQGDLVREVLDDNSVLAEEFSGFTLFTDHLGLYQGTSASVPALFTGRAYDFQKGHDWNRTKQEIQDFAYQKELRSRGFRLDFVSIVAPYCLDKAATCVLRPFNDLKARGYFRGRDESVEHSARLISDLTIFRHVPMFIKESVYNGGHWFLSDTNADGSSPFPDPVIREWVENMTVVEGPPRYKFYHYIGTHIPAQWDERCGFRGRLKHNRVNARRQTVCILSGIAHLLRKLKDVGIYDRTAIVITGDHGTNIGPDDLTGRRAVGLLPGIIGTARPAFLVKELDNENQIQANVAPTTLLDVAATALDLVGLDGEYETGSAMNLAQDQKRTRIFRRYSPELFWSGKPIPFEEFEVNGRANNQSSWQVNKTALAPAPERRAKAGVVFAAEPNPIPVCEPLSLASTTLSWATAASESVEVRVGSPHGSLFARSGATGEAATGAWVTDGMQFYLQDRSGGKALGPEDTLATLTIDFTEVGCPDRAQGVDLHPSR